MGRNCIAIRHLAFEDLGLFGPALEARGFTIRYVEAGVDDLAALAPAADDLMVVLGGPIGAYEEADYPWLAGEIEVVRRRLAAGRPTIGICLGAQLIARALGAAVYPAHEKEIGWAPVTLTTAGHLSPLKDLDNVPVLHWHGDTFDLPDNAVRLASTGPTVNQAFSIGDHVLGLQFHVEVTAVQFERWLVGHRAELGATKGISIPALRADMLRVGPEAERAGRQVIDSALDLARLT